MSDKTPPQKVRVRVHCHKTAPTSGNLGGIRNLFTAIDQGTTDGKKNKNKNHQNWTKSRNIYFHLCIGKKNNVQKYSTTSHVVLSDLMQLTHAVFMDKHG